MWPQSTFWRVAVVTLWILSAMAGALASPRYVEVCQHDSQRQQESCTNQRAALFLLAEVSEILNYLSPAIVALATIVVAAFTIRLKNAADRQWQVSEKAIIASQRAWLSIDKVWLKEPTAFKDNGITIAIDVRVSNLGNSPATNVWVMPESWFVKGPKHGDVKQGLIDRLRKHGKIPVGRALFPQENFTYGHIWHVPPEVFQASVSARDDNSLRVGLSILVGVSYLIAGDEEPHVTLCEFGMLNTRMGTDYYRRDPKELQVAAISQTIAD